MSEGLGERLERIELGELRDREAIRDVIHRYWQAVDRCDLELLKGCYHADAYDDHGFFAGNTHEFAEYVIPVLEQIDSSMHAITNTRIQLDGDRAACQSQGSCPILLQSVANCWADGERVFEALGNVGDFIGRSSRRSISPFRSARTPPGHRNTGTRRLTPGSGELLDRGCQVGERTR